MKRATRERGSRERGNTFVIMAFFLAGLLVLVAAAVDLAQVRQAQITVETAMQNAAADAARAGLQGALLVPCTKDCDAPRALAIADTDGVRKRVYASLERNLESAAYLMQVTPAEAAGRAQVAIVNPEDGRCESNPYAAGETAVCYYDPFVAVQIGVPMRALWGSLEFTYRTTVVAAVTDDPYEEHPATPIPTSTPFAVPTFPVPRPTCGSEC